MSLIELQAFHDICQLKYRYIRALDIQDWELLESCFTDDVVLWPNGGDYVARGRIEVMGMVRAILIDSFYTSHIAVHPEIDFIDDTHAKGIWRLEDTLIYTAPHPAITHTPIVGGEHSVGAAYYQDEYVKLEGKWRIRSCGFVRIFESLRRPGTVNAELSVDPGRGFGATAPV